MSDFKFPCPKCGQHIVCDTSNAGMQIQCPACQAMLTVPPPPPPPPATPGKLSISKQPHQPAPGPGPAAMQHAAPKPPPGMARPGMVSKKKKMPKWASALIYTLVALVVLGGAWYEYSQYAEKKHQEEVARQQAETAAKAAADKEAQEAAAKAKAARAVWSLDLASENFPVRPVSGKIHGANFTAENISFQNGMLMFRQTTGSPAQFLVALPSLKTGETYSGKSYEISPTNTVYVPKVVMSWKEEQPHPPGNRAFTKGYAMKLQFGEIKDGQMSTKIFLCLPDEEQSLLAGEFTVGHKQSATPAAGEPQRRPHPKKLENHPGQP